MSDIDPTLIGSNPFPLSPEHFEAVALIVEHLGEQKGEPWDHEADLEGELMDDPLGRRWEISNIENETVALTAYDEAGKKYQSKQENLAAMLKPGELPLGHLEVLHRSSDTWVDGAVYVLDSGRIRIQLDCHLSDPEMVFSNESEKCFDFLNRLGLGEIWTKFLFRVGSETSVRMESDMNDLIGRNFLAFLAGNIKA